MNTIFTNTLPTKTASLLSILQEKNPSFLRDFYLSGRTALSLLLGHRESEDLDFFIQQPFNPQILEQSLLTFGALEQTELAPNTLNTFLRGVKLQFLEYPYRLIKPTIPWESILLSSVEDIACTKLQTIGMRGSKKDFIDIYILLQKYPLQELFALASQKYPDIDYSQVHIMKSLVYFEDAENQPMPRMHQKVSWDELKKYIIAAVKAVKFN